MTSQEIAERNAKVVNWYSSNVAMRKIVARTRLTQRQIYRIVGNLPKRGWQDSRRKRNGHSQ